MVHQDLDVILRFFPFENWEGNGFCKKKHGCTCDQILCIRNSILSMSSTIPRPTSPIYGGITSSFFVDVVVALCRLKEAEHIKRFVALNQCLIANYGSKFIIIIIIWDRWSRRRDGKHFIYQNRRAGKIINFRFLAIFGDQVLSLGCPTKANEVGCSPMGGFLHSHTA